MQERWWVSELNSIHLLSPLQCPNRHMHPSASNGAPYGCILYASSSREVRLVQCKMEVYNKLKRNSQAFQTAQEPIWQAFF